MRVIEVAEKYKSAPHTTEEIIEYVDSNKPSEKAEYVNLIRSFEKGGKVGKGEDKKFYKWIITHCNEVKVLEPLKEHENLEDFVFNFGGVDNPLYNQKWHFYVSYLALKEYRTINNLKDGFDIEDGEMIVKRFPSFKCRELIMWKNAFDF